MGRRKPREKWTADEIIADVIQWANRQQLMNVAAALHRARQLLKDGRHE